MSAWITPKEGATRFRNLAKEIENESVKALRRATHAWRKKAFQIFSQRGLGQVFGDRTAVLGRKPRGATTAQARVIIKREPVKKLGGGLFRTGLRLRGFAALVEMGGKTKPHPITASRGEVLGQQPLGLGTDARGNPIFARSVKHPGSRIPRQPFVEAAGRQSEGEFKRQMEIAKQRSIELAKLVD